MGRCAAVVRRSRGCKRPGSVRPRVAPAARRREFPARRAVARPGPPIGAGPRRRPRPGDSAHGPPQRGTASWLPRGEATGARPGAPGDDRSTAVNRRPRPRLCPSPISGSRPVAAPQGRAAAAARASRRSVPLGSAAPGDSPRRLAGPRGSPAPTRRCRERPGSAAAHNCARRCSRSRATRSSSRGARRPTMIGSRLWLWSRRWSLTRFCGKL